jgi:CheY-like chemotaxis protein
VARIVIVEDEIQVLMLAESVLQQAGHDTVCASTVAEAKPSSIQSMKSLIWSSPTWS